MKASFFRWVTPGQLAVAFAMVVWAAGALIAARADQIQMANGDRYLGKVLSLNNDTLILQSDVLGTLRLPRAKVAWINLGAAAGTNWVGLQMPTNNLNRVGASATNNAAPELNNQFRALGANSNLIQQIQKRYLSDAGPEATEKFNDLLGGLMSGRLNVTDIRAQAQATATQVRSMRKDLGEEAGWMLDTYLAILDHFVNETAPLAGSQTNAVPLRSQPKSSSAAEEE